MLHHRTASNGNRHYSGDRADVLALFATLTGDPAYGVYSDGDFILPTGGASTIAYIVKRDGFSVSLHIGTDGSAFVIFGSDR